MIYSESDIRTRLEALPQTHGPTRWLSLDLSDSDTAWSARASADYTGPGSVVYVLYASGRIYGEFSEPEDKPEALT